jgi:hypothetical protein
MIPMASLITGNWKLNANGYPGTLTITAIDTNGNLTSSTAFGNKIIGFWDEDGRKITFIRVMNENDPSTFQIYTGYLMGTTTIAGSFEAFQGGGGAAKRSVFGWFATTSTGTL